MAARTVPVFPSFFAGQKLTGTFMNQIGSYATFWANPPMFRMVQSVAQGIANNITTQITNDTSQYDTDSGRSGVSPYNYTIPVSMTGRWYFCAGIAWANNSTGFRVVILERNGSPVMSASGDVAADTDNTVVTTSGTITVNAGDVMTVWGYQNSGGALNTVANSQYASFFEGRLISLANP